MPNTLTGLFPSLYAALNVVSREMTGMVMAVSKDATAEQAAIGQSILSPVVQNLETEDITPSYQTYTGSNRDVRSVDVQITKQKRASFHLTGEDYMKLSSSGTVSDITSQSIQQAFRALANEIEVDLGGLYVDACRAHGTPGSHPFQSPDNLVDIAALTQILNVNGAPMTGRSLILNDTHKMHLEGRQPSVFKVNEAGEPMGRRAGAMGMLLGFDLGAAVQMPTHAAAANALSAQINRGAGYEKGDTVLTVDGVAAGEGQAKGSLVSIAGSEGSYLLGEALAGSGNTITLNAPGLIAAAANDAAVTNAATAWTPSIALTRDAAVLVCRTPALPPDGDIAADRMTITDPVSGLSFDVADYRQYRQNTIEVSIAWGVKTIKSEHMCLLVS